MGCLPSVVFQLCFRPVLWVRGGALADPPCSLCCARAPSLRPSSPSLRRRQDLDRHLWRPHAAQRYHGRQGLPLFHPLRLVWRGPLRGASAVRCRAVLCCAALQPCCRLCCSSVDAGRAAGSHTTLLSPTHRLPRADLQVSGTISREDGTPVYRLEGMWNEYLEAGACRSPFTLFIHSCLAASPVLPWQHSCVEAPPRLASGRSSPPSNASSLLSAPQSSATTTATRWRAPSRCGYGRCEC